MSAKKSTRKKSSEAITMEALEKLARHVLELLDIARKKRDDEKAWLVPNLEQQLATLMARFLPATPPHTDAQVSDALHAAATIYGRAREYVETERAKRKEDEEKAIAKSKQDQVMLALAKKIVDTRHRMNLSGDCTLRRIFRAWSRDKSDMEEVKDLVKEAMPESVVDGEVSLDVVLAENVVRDICFLAWKKEHKVRYEEKKAQTAKGKETRLHNLKQEKAKKAAATRIQGHLDKPVNKPPRKKNATSSKKST